MIEIRQPGSENEEIGSYEEFVEKGHSFVWCLVANITEEHEFGEEHEIKVGVFIGIIERTHRLSPYLNAFGLLDLQVACKEV